MAKKKYNLVGIDSNAFSIMGYVSKSMKSEGKSKEEIDKFYEEAQSGDYNNLLRVSVTMIEELNKK